jgi:tetratricopeptide (TPR) repeat protein
LALLELRDRLVEVEALFGMDVADAIRAGYAAEEGGDFVGATAAYASLAGHADPRIVAEANFHLGRVAWKQMELDRALTHCETARALAIRLGDQDLRARVENAAGAVHVSRSEYNQAQAAYTLALDLTADLVTRGKIVLNLGVISNIQGALTQARRYYTQSLALFREADDDRGEALALHNLGLMHSDLKEWDEAEESFRGALALFERHGNKQMIAHVLENRSEVTYGRGNAQEAIGQCDLAIAIYAEIGDERGRGEALRWKGYGLRLLGRHGAAINALNESIRISQRLQIKLLEAEATRELAFVYKADNRSREARNTFVRALTMFADLGARRDLESVEAELAKLG